MVKALMRILRAPARMIRSLRYDSDPYGAGQQQQSGEDAMRHGSVNGLGHWN